MKKIIYLLSILLLTSCASKQLVVHFDQVKPDQVTASHQATFKHKKKLHLEKVTDARVDSTGNQIGIASTGFSHQQTPVVLRDNFEPSLMSLLSQRMSDRGFNMVDNSGSADLIVQAQVKKFLFKEKNVLLSENGICESEVTFNVFDPKSKKRLTIDTSGQVSLPGVNVSQIVPKTMASCVDVIVTKLAETNLWNELML